MSVHVVFLYTLQTMFADPANPHIQIAGVFRDASDARAAQISVVSSCTGRHGALFSSSNALQSVPADSFPRTVSWVKTLALDVPMLAAVSPSAPTSYHHRAERPP